MKSMSQRRALAWAVLVLVVVGCGSPRAGSRIVKHEKAYGSVVSLSPSTTMLIAENGGSSFISGRTESCDLPSYIKSIKAVVKGTKPDYEAILSVDPSLIVYDKALYSDDEIAKLKDLDVELMEYSPNNLQEYSDFIYRIGSKLAIEMFTSGYIDKIEKSRAIASNLIVNRPKVTILLGSAEEGYYVMGTDGLHADVLKVSGGTPVGVEGNRFAPLNIEQLIAWDPEVIYSDGHADDVYADPRLKTVKAIKEFHVYDSDSRYLTRMSSKIDTYIDRFARDLREKFIIKPGTGRP